MNLSLMISKRLRLKPEGKGRRQSPGVTIAVTGIAVAVVVMILTLAVVSGFQNQVRQKVMGFDSQITVKKYTTNSSESPFFSFNDSISGVMRSVLPEGAVLSPCISATTLLKTDEDYIGLQLVSDDETLNGYISEYLVEKGDSILPDEKSIVISRITATRLNLCRGDRIYAHFFVDGNVKTRRLMVSAVYDTSFGERDKRIAFCDSRLLRSVYDLDANDVEKIHISGLQFSEIESLAEDLQQVFVAEYYSGGVGEVYQVESVLRTGAAYFGWLDLLDTNVVVIIILMTVVAAFTLVSSLFILVLERVRMIGVLKALGATNGMVSRIFVYLAMRIMAYGLLIGNVSGLLLIWVQWQFRVLPLDPEAYYLSYVPVEFNFIPWILLNVGAVLVAWLVLILPAMVVSRISPATTIRYE